MMQDVKVGAEVEVPIINDAQERTNTTLIITTEGLTEDDEWREAMISTNLREEDIPQIHGTTPDPDQLARGHLAMQGSTRKVRQTQENYKNRRRI